MEFVGMVMNSNVLHEGGGVGGLQSSVCPNEKVLAEITVGYVVTSYTRVTRASSKTAICKRDSYFVFRPVSLVLRTHEPFKSVYTTHGAFPF
jgi:hypothetical protein